MPFGIFPKIHPIWWPDPSLSEKGTKNIFHAQGVPATGD